VFGFSTWNIYGTSYGSYLAQTLMRDHPEGIRSVILDSVLPTTYNVAANWQNARDGFDNIFKACAAAPACNASHPHLEKTFDGLVNRLEAEPLTEADESKNSARLGKSLQQATNVSRLAHYAYAIVTGTVTSELLQRAILPNWRKEYRGLRHCTLSQR
jgi:pimeloyl-ACP methyl ester carboxylesterase